MEQNELYKAPQSDVRSSIAEPSRMFALKGRLRRSHYVAYTLGFTLIAYVILFGMSLPLALLEGDPSDLVFGIVGLVAVALFVGVGVLTVIWTVRRSHDFNYSGWTTLLLLVPFAALLFYFMPGTKGDNDYGPQPPHSRPLFIACLVMLALIVVATIGFFALLNI